MGNLVRFFFPLRILHPILGPLARLFVGIIAVPLFRLVAKRLVLLKELDRELEKDLEEWFRGSLLLLVATANMEDALFGWVPLDLQGEMAWLAVGGRVLLAISVIEAMPDQELFAVIHPGPPQLKFQKGQIWAEIWEQKWNIGRGLICQHLNRSSPVWAILAAIFTGPVGWIFYGLALFQYLLIGLVTSRDKAIDVLAEFDRQVAIRRKNLIEEFDLQESTSEPDLSPKSRLYGDEKNDQTVPPSAVSSRE